MPSLVSVSITAIVLAGILATSPAAAERFWLAGQDPVVLKQQHKSGDVDFMTLFKPEAPWQASASQLSVFKFSTQFVLGASDEMLRQAFGELRRRQIQTALEIGAVIRLDRCGMGEGYAPPGMSDQVGKRLRALDLTLDYMALDEPVWFAHEKNWGKAPGGAPNCAYPLPVVAERAAMSVEAMRRYFPLVQYGDVESIASDHTPPRRLIEDYGTFARLMQQKLGQKPAFFHADIAWKTDWQPMMAPLSREMAGLGVPYGIIIGGSPDDPTDEAWVTTAMRRLQFLEKDPATRPAEIVVQSWQSLPTHMLPDTSKGTSTWLLRQAEAVGAR